MNNHHCTCHQCKRLRQQAGDEAFADMVVLAQFHPEWFTFGDDHVNHHDYHDAFADGDVCHDDTGMDMEAMEFWG